MAPQKSLPFYFQGVWRGEDLVELGYHQHIPLSQFQKFVFVLRFSVNSTDHRSFPAFETPRGV